jgi:hypothetical protein
MNKTVRYIGIDPGKTVGYAFFNDEGKPIQHGQMDWEMFIKCLAGMSDHDNTGLPVTFVVENFKLLVHKAASVARNVASRSMEASQIIGAVRLLCELKDNYELVLQNTDALHAGAAWAGLDMKVGEHSKTNWKSAYSHVTFYIVQNKIRKVKEIREDATPQA